MRSSISRIVLLVTAVGATSAFAAETPPPPEAVKHSQACMKAYDLAEYQRAIVECKAAYEIFPAPLLLFSLGQAHRKLGQLSLAVEFYRKYLAKAPSGSRLRDAQEQIAQLEPLVAATEKSKAAPPDSATPEAPDRATPKPVATMQSVTPSPATDQGRWYTRPIAIAGFVTLPLGVVILGTGGGLLGKASSLRNDATKATSLADIQQFNQSANNFSSAGYALIAVGGASAIVGAVLTGVAAKRPQQVSASISPSPGGVSMFVGGVF